MFDKPPLPQGAMTESEVKHCQKYRSQDVIFYVHINAGKLGKIKRAKAGMMVGCGPGCYFQNYWFAYAHSLKVKNGGKR